MGLPLFHFTFSWEARFTTLVSSQANFGIKFGTTAFCFLVSDRFDCVPTRIGRSPNRVRSVGTRSRRNRLVSTGQEKARIATKGFRESHIYEFSVLSQRLVGQRDILKREDTQPQSTHNLTKQKKRKQNVAKPSLTAGRVAANLT